MIVVKEFERVNIDLIILWCAVALLTLIALCLIFVIVCDIIDRNISRVIVDTTIFVLLITVIICAATTAESMPKTERAYGVLENCTETYSELAEKYEVVDYKSGIMIVRDKDVV